MQIRDEFDEWVHSAKSKRTPLTMMKARGGLSALQQTLKGLSNDAGTKDLLEAARKLSKKSKGMRTSSRVTSDDPESSTAGIFLQTAPSSDYSVVPNNELTAQSKLCGIGFSFDRRPTPNDTRKIETVIHLIDPELYSDDEESGSVRALRSRRSDLSTFSYHNWGPEAYNTE
ncbi:hypothetical protein M405DRAFT_862838 [Rhizopogon salebrosus TDB-379]|nr:hypothetical protein M405DRAFT_862838 [Rhizopogon salebrosus TDB-379]